MVRTHTHKHTNSESLTAFKRIFYRSVCSLRWLLMITFEITTLGRHQVQAYRSTYRGQKGDYETGWYVLLLASVFFVRGLMPVITTSQACCKVPRHRSLQVGCGDATNLLRRLLASTCLAGQPCCLPQRAPMPLPIIGYSRTFHILSSWYWIKLNFSLRPTTKCQTFARSTNLWMLCLCKVSAIFVLACSLLKVS